MNEQKRDWQKTIFILLFFLSIILFGALLKIMEEVVKPVIVSILTAFIFFPMIRKLSTKFKIPWGIGIAIVYILSFGIFFGIGNILFASFKSILDAAPEYATRFDSISKSISEAFSNNKDSLLFELLNFDKEQSIFANLQGAVNFTEPLKNLAVEFTSFVFSFSKMLFLVILFSIFLLVEMKITSKKVSKALGGKYSERAKTIIKKTITEITHYISIKFMMSFVSGIFVTIVCALFKMDFSIVWGFLAFVMNFIPTFGSLIAWAITTLFALIQFYPSPIPVIAISALVIFENVLIGNIIEPKIEGKDLNLSPFIILVSLLLWGWLWGFLGLLLAVPFTVTIKIVCENISFLKPIAIFLGSQTDSSKD